MVGMTHTQVLVIDLAVLRFEWGDARRSINAWTPARRLLATVAVAEGCSEREAVFNVLDAALAAPVVTEHGPAQLGLYNPFSAQIALSPVPDTLSYSDRRPIVLDEEGSIAELHGDVLVLDGRELEALEPNLAEVERAFAAHRR